MNLDNLEVCEWILSKQFHSRDPLHNRTKTTLDRTVWKCIKLYLEKKKIVKKNCKIFAFQKYRLWWIIAFGVSFWLCGSSILGLWIKWHRNLVTLKIIENDVSITNIPFPTVTICPETKTTKDKIDLSSIIIENRSNISDFTGIE